MKKRKKHMFRYDLIQLHQANETITDFLKKMKKLNERLYAVVVAQDRKQKIKQALTTIKKRESKQDI